jgi:hypothetical protein
MRYSSLWALPHSLTLFGRFEDQQPATSFRSRDGARADFFVYPPQMRVCKLKSECHNKNSPLTTSVNGLQVVERKGVEPSTSALRTQRSPH